MLWCVVVDSVIFVSYHHPTFCALQQLAEGDVVADMFCGIGLLTLVLNICDLFKYFLPLRYRYHLSASEN